MKKKAKKREVATVYVVRCINDGYFTPSGGTGGTLASSMVFATRAMATRRCTDCDTIVPCRLVPLSSKTKASRKRTR